MTKAVVFLGNPGKEYEKSRHNLGWMVCASLSFYPQLTWNRKFNGLYACYAVTEGNRLFLKPAVFMNKSGESAVRFAQFFRLTPQELLIVHDDLELDFGTFALKKGGGAAGHNGLRSVAAKLGTGDFARLRLGISRPQKGTVDSYVLSRFSRVEEMLLPAYLQKAARFLEEQLGIT